MIRIKESGEYHSPPGVTIAFERVSEEGVVSIVIYRDRVPPDMVKLEGATLYYVIDTTYRYKGTIEIRILVPIFDPETDGQIFEWTGEGWHDRTSYSKRVGHYRLIIGEVDHLSGFGIRT